MNSKYVKYVLIAGVVVVWAAIVYRVINGLNTDSPIVTAPPSAIAREVKPASDSFSLNADYPDPFLPELDTSASDGAAGKGNTGPAQVPVSPSPPPPKEDMASMFQLEGVIANAQKRTRVAIVRIKGSEYVVKELDRIGDFKIMKIRKGKIYIVYKEREYRITKI